MANPQIENGFLRIANEIAEALSTVSLSASESKLLWVVLRKTYGWNKKEATISVTDIQKLTGLDRRNASRAKAKLIRRNIINQASAYLKLNKDYDSWDTGKAVSGYIYRDTRPRWFPPAGFPYKDSHDTHCEWCCKILKFEETNSHHIIPTSLGGSDVPANRARLCFSCHKQAHDLIKSVVNSDDMSSIQTMYRQFVSLLSSAQTQYMSSLKTIEVSSQMTPNKDILKDTPKDITKDSNVEKDKIPYSEIISDLNEVLGTKYRDKTEETRQAIRRWWKQGFQLEDFKAVHRIKKEEWGGTEQAVYLRPSTLYGPKFENYLNQGLAKPREIQPGEPGYVPLR